MAYTLIDRIGQGGFGIVDFVLDDGGNPWARKTFHIANGHNFDAAARKNVKERFIREIKVQSSIKHKNIVPIVDYDILCDPPYYIMRLADSSLETDIIADKTLNGNFPQALADILSGLEELHGMGLYHRDLKPANVLRFADSSGKTYYAISDFGLMSLKQTNITTLTKTGMRMQSDMYTAPEIVVELKNATAQSDIYSVGCILHDFVKTDDRIPCAEIKEPNNPYGMILQMCTRLDKVRRFKSVARIREALLALGNISIVPTTPKGIEILDILSKDSNSITEGEWKQTIDFIEDQYTSEDAKTCLWKTSRDHIESLTTRFPVLAKSLSFIFAKWVRNSSFPFGDCDGLANRTEVFLKINEVEVQSECLLALLYMGTRHNRWYVEQRFVSYVGKNASESLAKRIALEIRVDEEIAYKAFKHLKVSISYEFNNLHPVILDALKEVSK